MPRPAATCLQEGGAEGRVDVDLLVRHHQHDAEGHQDVETGGNAQRPNNAQRQVLGRVLCLFGRVGHCRRVGQVVPVLVVCVCVRVWVAGWGALSMRLACQDISFWMRASLPVGAQARSAGHAGCGIP